MTLVAYGYGISPGVGGGGDPSCTAVLDPIVAEVVLPTPTLVFPPLTAVLDVIVLESVWEAPDSETVSVPVPLSDPSIPRTRSGDIGGTFLGSSGSGKIRDRNLIQSWGFTILEERPRAGRTDFIVHGGIDQAQFISMNKTDIQCSIPFLLYFLPVGEVITVELILDNNMTGNEL